MERREYVRITGAVSVGSLAGCLGFGEDGDDGVSDRTTSSGPASFGDVTLAPPDDPSAGKSMPVEVAATNLGGKPGRFADTLTVRGPTETTLAVVIPDVQPGERASTTVDPGLWTAGEYDLALQNVGVTGSMSVVAQSGSMGTTLELSDGVEVTLDGLELRPQSIVYDEGGEDPAGSALPAGDGDAVFAAFSVTVDNGSDRAVDLAQDTFELPVDADASYLHFVRNPYGWPLDEHASTLDADRIYGTTVPAGSTRSGVILGQVTYDVATGTIPFAGQHDREGLPELLWGIEPSGGSRSLPRFEITDVSLPDRIEVDTDFEYGITVENTGDAHGPFEGLLQRSMQNANGRRAMGYHRRELSVGGSATISGTASVSSVGSYDLWLQPHGSISRIEVKRPTRQFGEGYVLENGAEVYVVAPEVTDEIGIWDKDEEDDVLRYNAPTWSDDSGEYIKPILTVGVIIKFENSLNKSIDLPGYSDFYAVLNDGLGASMRAQTYRGSTIRDFGERDHMFEPYQGPLLSKHPEKQIDNGEVHGWLPFVTSKNYSKAESAVRLHMDDRETPAVTWQAESDRD